MTGPTEKSYVALFFRMPFQKISGIRGVGRSFAVVLLVWSALHLKCVTRSTRTLLSGGVGDGAKSALIFKGGLPTFALWDQFK